VDGRRGQGFPTTLPSLVSSHLLTGCGHWVQQERPDDLNQILVDWLRSVHPDT
jgi:pimeloyl-ACP methyl ester carboxylesterase